MSNQMMNWHRRRALMLATQLPDDIADARLVLEAANELVETFLTERIEGPARPDVLLLNRDH